jgi:uncharacterized protein with HEPN domain
MRREALYLADMVDAADAIERFVEGVNYDHFVGDELRQSAVLQKLIVIGEAAARLSPEFRARYSHIEWDDVVGFRNIAVHEYFAVNWSIVWVTAVEDVPFLRQQVARIIVEEDADD